MRQRQINSRTPAGRTPISYDRLSHLSQVTDAAQHTATYGFDTSGRFSTVTNADSSSRTYLYENASLVNAVTGVMDENNTRYSTWHYDTQGRVIDTTEAGGAEAATLSYASTSTGGALTGNLCGKGSR
jgi:YD repeat-containing protein